MVRLIKGVPTPPKFFFLKIRGGGGLTGVQPPHPKFSGGVETPQPPPPLFGAPASLRRILATSKPYSASQVFVSGRIIIIYNNYAPYYRLMSCYVNLYVGLLRKLKTIQIQLYMPAYHHLFSYTLQVVNGGAHNLLTNVTPPIFIMALY